MDVVSTATLASLPLTLVLAGCSSSAASGGDGSPDVQLPLTPTYAADVQPIFQAHCVMCHGANGTLNDALHPDGTPSTLGAPSVCYLSMYDDAGDCSVGDGGVISSTCKRGAHYCATPDGDPPQSYIEVYALVLAQDEGGMPPMPLPPLSANEKEVIRRWLENPLP